MKTQKDLIKHYTSNLEKVKGHWSDGTERSQGYIDYAAEMLEIVTQSGQEGLIEFWDSRKDV